MDVQIRKGCNRYSNAHCYLVQSKDFEITPNYLEGNQVGGAVNQFAINPNSTDSLVEKLTSGTLTLIFPDGSFQTFEGVLNETNGLDFTPNPVIPITAENQGNWRLLFDVKYTTVSDYNCPLRGFETTIEVGTTVEEENGGLG